MSTDFAPGHDGLSDDELDSKLAKLAASVARTDVQNRYALFTPLHFQRPWYRSAKKIRCLFGANQVGKTLYLIINALGCALGAMPPSVSGKLLPPGFPRHKLLTPRRVLIVGESFTTVPGNLVPKLEEYMPEGAVRQIRKTSSGCPNFYALWCGSEIHLMSKDQHPKKFEANVWDMACIDEPLDQPVFNAIQRGTMRKSGPMIIAGTPISGGWMRDVLEMPSKDATSALGEKIDVFRAKIWDNARSNGGYLPA